MGHHLDARAAFGRLARATQCLQGEGPLSLLSFLPWLRMLAGWEQLHRQHDAAEFMTFVIGKSEPEAFRGGWQSRLQEDGSDLVVDSGTCFAPISIEVTGRSLQHCIYDWHLQHSIQALSDSPQLLFLQLKRFRETPHGTDKDFTAVQIPAGELVRIPCFRNCHDVETSIAVFEVAGVVYHLGDSLLAGHYRAALSASAREDGNLSVYHITDDNSSIVEHGSCSSDVDTNGYVVGLRRIA